MDWEPEVPGQFDTPLRVRRKRAAGDAGFSTDGIEAAEAAPVALFPVNYSHRLLIRYADTPEERYSIKQLPGPNWVPSCGNLPRCPSRIRIDAPWCQLGTQSFYR